MKITLLRNNVTDTATLDAGIAQAKTWCATIGLDLEFTIHDTARQFSSIHYANDVNPDGYIVDPTQIFQEAKSLAPDFDCCVLIFDHSKITGGMPTNPADNGQDIQMSTEWYVTFPEVFASFLLHELCHFLFSSQIVLPDITHLQYQSTQYHNKQNWEWYLYLLGTLRSSWPVVAPSSPIVELTRTSDDGKETRGTLTYGTFSCDTLERPWLANQRNISCIPKGTYQCKWAFKGNSLAFHFLVQNVPNRSGIFIHQGNYVTDSEGCILLGRGWGDVNHDGEQDVLSSRVTLASFEQLLNKQPFTLVIK